ncbi:MAG: hypothetical protein HWE34_13985 [Methylocystaceae bacterium]|nr:hypothetical protein [Methylocystaceae bacterium]
MPQRDQTTSAKADQAGRVDYPQDANVRPASAKSPDQLASAIPLNADALKDAERYGLEEAEQGNSYRVAQASRTGVMSDVEKSSQISPYEQVPDITKREEREKNIIDNKPGKFPIEKNPEADDGYKLYEIPAFGRIMLNQYDSTISKLAEKHGVDPDRVRAVLWAENSRGHKGPMNFLMDVVGLSSSKLPMNINPEIWGGLLDKKASDLSDPKENIEAATLLLKRLEDRVENKDDMAAIGTLWNGLGLEKTNDFGEYIARVYREKPWLKKPFQ